MATKKLHLFEHLSSEGLLQVNESLGILILWGLFYILLFTILSFAFNVPTGDLSDYQDSSVLEDIMFHLGWGIRSRQNSTAVVPPGFFVLLLFHQHLRGHIGEKRPEASNEDLKNLRFRTKKTALSCSAVFCVFLSALFIEPDKRAIRFMLGKDSN